jgi:hypothetical protein
MLFLKEHVRGPLRECEAILNDILTEMRCEELKRTDLYNVVPVVVKGRNVEDNFGGKGQTRCLARRTCNIYEFEVLGDPLRCVVVPDTVVDDVTVAAGILVVVASWCGFTCR